LILEEEAKIKFNINTITDQISVEDIAINTDPILFSGYPEIVYSAEKQIIPS
jgi:hypothetical protein